jgi:hypothetical protein
MDGTDPHFFIALLKFVLWHSLGTGVFITSKVHALVASLRMGRATRLRD